MVLFQIPWLSALSGAVILLHILPAILRGKAAIIGGVVNICLHIALIVLMLLYKVPFDEAVLFIVLSTFVYTLLYLVFVGIGRRRGER